MRVAALYDIHGNLPALEAVLADVDESGVDTILVGGDVAGGPMPRETLEAIRARREDVAWVRGNGDRAVGGSMDDPPDPWAWAGRQLPPADRAFLASLPTTVVLEIDGLGETLFCHGSPRSDDEILTRISPPDRVAGILASVREETVVCGHTHTQFDRAIGGIRLVNAGSVGMAYEDEPGAYWALFGPGVELRRTAYDRDAAAERIRKTAFPLAEEFACDHVLTVTSGDEAAAFFESVATRGHG